MSLEKARMSVNAAMERMVRHGSGDFLFTAAAGTSCSRSLDVSSGSACSSRILG